MTQTSEAVADWCNYLTRNELVLLKGIATDLPPNPLVINIGAGHGTATLGVLEVRPDALIFSIDTTAGEDPINTGEHLRLQEAGLHLTGSVIRIWGASQIIGKRWRFPADLVIVDGDHSAAGIRGDLEVWLPQVKPGGIILCHDYKRKHWPAVAEAIDEIMASYRPAWACVDTYIAFRVGQVANGETRPCPGGFCSCEKCDMPSC